MKICAVCSHGGHLAELMQLKNVFDGHDVSLITYKDATTDSISELYPFYNIYYINILNEKILQLNLFWLILHMIYVSFFEFKILFKENPKIIISTGSEIALPICYLAWVLNRKVIYIESMSRISDLSRTGRLVYPIADIFLVQWSHLIKKYSKAKYAGRVL